MIRGGAAKIFFAIPCVAALVGTLSVYSLRSREPKADFTYVNPSGIHTLDPARMSWTQDFRVALNIWEGLTTLDPRTLLPMEGSAFFPPAVSENGLTYTFTIRNDAKWSNGEPVTAKDFIRGWRRGMEPGSVTDYAFLLTDQIAGAADYVNWRQDSVVALTALSRLKDGWDIDARQARGLVRHRLFEHVRAANVPPVVEAEHDRESDAGWAELGRSFGRLDVDWSAVHEEALDDHAARIEERFARVGVEAPDEQTLIVHLARPCPYFLDLTALPIFYPCHNSIELLRERYRGAPITAQGLVVYDPQWTKPRNRRNGYPGLITNGAYRMDDWIFKRRVRLTVNPFYRQADSIACRVIDMLVFENVNAALMAYEAGDVDFLPSMAVSYDHEIARLARTGQRKDFHLCPVLATYFLNFNCVSATVGGRRNPFVDGRVRKAFSLAVDKDRIVHNVLKRGDRVAHSFVPPGAIPGYEPPAGLLRDVEEARRLLGEAGYPGGTGLGSIELLYTTRDERVVQALAHIWERELGVHIELRAKESKTFAQDKASHRYMIARGNWYADYNDPTTFLNCLTSGNGNNDSGYTSTRYDELILEAGAVADPTRRAALLRKAEAIIVEDDFPILPIFHYAEPIAVKPYVKGLHLNARLWFPFRYVSVQP